MGNILPTTRRVELIGKKEFATTSLDLEYKIFIVHIAAPIIDSDDRILF